MHFLLGLIHVSNNEWTGNDARISPKSVVKDVKKRKSENQYNYMMACMAARRHTARAGELFHNMM